VALAEVGFVKRIKAIRAKGSVEATEDRDSENEASQESDSELWMKHEYRTSTERLSIEGADRGAECMRLWKSDAQVMQARTSLECSAIIVLARVNARTDSDRQVHDGKAIQGKRVQMLFLKGKVEEGDREGRLSHGMRIFGKTGEWRRVGRRLFNGLKSVAIPSFAEILRKSYITECGSVESVLFKASSNCKELEN
jgi:hypothetical protein